MRVLLKNNPKAHFFCDEAPIGEDGIPSNDWIEFSKEVQQNCFFWIACNRHWPPKFALEDGKLFLLVSGQMFYV